MHPAGRRALKIYILSLDLPGGVAFSPSWRPLPCGPFVRVIPSLRYPLYPFHSFHPTRDYRVILVFILSIPRCVPFPSTIPWPFTRPGGLIVQVPPFRPCQSSIKSSPFLQSPSSPYRVYPFITSSIVNLHSSFGLLIPRFISCFPEPLEGMRL